MIDESSYSPGEFTIHLKKADWTAYGDPQSASSDSKSALLHEYIHYIQDTASYYGTIYRKQIYENKKDMDVIGANGDALIDLLCMGELSVEGMRPTFDSGRNICILGSLALKESMAQEAQRIVFGERSIASSQSVYYRGITQIIDCYLPYAKDVTYLRFCIEDSCLMTDDPAKSLLQLLDSLVLQDIKALIEGLNEKEQIDILYKTIEGTLLELGLLRYDKIDTLGIDSQEFSYVNKEHMSCGLFNTEESFIAEHNRFMEVADIIDQKRIENLRRRKNEHSVVAQALRMFYESKEIHTLYNVFGMPMINSIDSEGQFISNKDYF